MHNLIKLRSAEIAEIVTGLNAVLKDRHVKIISDYNGQPHGRSRKSMKGKEFEIERVTVSSWKIASIAIHLKGELLAVWPEEVEFL